MNHPYLPSLYEKPKVIFEVGAHAGDPDLIDYCRRTGAQLYMFEPLPSRYEELLEKTKDVPSIQVFPLAVSNYDGQTTFNIANSDDCSSMLDFDEQVNETWLTKWMPFERFEMVDQIEVDVIRLDTFMDQHQIKQVDLIEIDTQGQDLKVVESLGDKLRQVKKIQVEVNVFHAPLYQQSCDKQEVMDFFEEHDFEKHVSWKQSMNREENITFRNRRFYPNSLYNMGLSTLEQITQKGYYTSARFLIVSRRMSGLLFQRMLKAR
ncbi:FkbM family methyltransferase [Chloroflexi bacterium TSY]|nr:FkbM family methyltransferase [Chloroflexi bacterium TSY]WAB21633.1 methyltransferase AtsH [Chloroflexota bacterium]